MRTRLLMSMLLVALVAVGVLGIPLGFAGTHLIRNEAIRQLERDAATVGVAVAHNLETGRPIDPAQLRKLLLDAMEIPLVEPRRDKNFATEHTESTEII